MDTKEDLGLHEEGAVPLTDEELGLVAGGGRTAHHPSLPSDPQ